MAKPRRPGHGEHPPADRFSIDPTSYLPMALASRAGPDTARFPVNHAGSHVRQQVWGDLVGSSDPVVVAGFSSIGVLIDLAAAWAHRQREGSLRVLLGSEPFATERSSFSSAQPGAGGSDWRLGPRRDRPRRVRGDHRGPRRSSLDASVLLCWGVSGRPSAIVTAMKPA